MTTGTQIAARLAGLTGKAREDAIWQAVVDDEFPAAFDGPWIKVALPTQTIGGVAYSLVDEVAPDFFALGTDADPLYIAAPPTLAMRIAKRFNATLPTRTEARAIYKASTVRAPMAVPINDAKNQPRNDTASWVESTAKVLAKIGGSHLGTGALVAGGGKDVVLGPQLDGSRVAIYGGLGGSVEGWAWQPYSTIHDVAYYDHSHRFRMVKRRAWLNGKEIERNDDVAIDKTLFPLINDHGQPFALSFPNTTSYGGFNQYSGGSGGPPTPPKPAPKPVPKPKAQPADGGGWILAIGGGLAIALGRLRRR